MNQDDISRLLRGRDIIETYRKESAEGKSPSTQVLHDAIMSAGFVSLDEFFQFNDDMNLKCLVYSYLITGECDDCNGLPSKRCVDLGFWGSGEPTVCGQFVTRTREKFVSVTGVDFVSQSKGTYPITYEYVIREQMRTGTPYNDFKNTTCPQGHGYVIVKQNEPPFDWTWR